MKTHNLNSLWLMLAMLCISVGASAYTVENFFTGSGASLISVTNDTSYPWTVGDDGVMVSNMHKHGGFTKITFTNTSSVSVECSFQWKKIGEGQHDYIYYSIDGQQKASNQTDNGEYQLVSCELAAGQKLSFTYIKDGSATNMPDCGYVKELSFTSSSFTDNSGNVWTGYCYTDNTCKNLSYSGEQTSVTIPSVFKANGKEYNVTALGQNVFKNNTTVTSITIPNSVTSIEGSAFSGCI